MPIRDRPERVMKTYFAMIRKDEDSVFGATLPDLPGCFP